MLLASLLILIANGIVPVIRVDGLLGECISPVTGSKSEGTTTAGRGIMRFVSCVLLFVTLASPAVCTPADEPVIKTPAELWAKFDPEAEPLEEQVVESWADTTGRYQKLYFTGETVDNTKIRVFAIVGVPPNDKRKARNSAVPGILHIHGGGQTASLEWVKFWCERGYACATFDFCGVWQERKEFTDWGPLRHCNMAYAEGGMQVEPTPRASSWYHWTRIARRVLTLLANQPDVDSERLGIFGISVGGSLCWSVAAFDCRVRTAVPIYGCGYNTDESRMVWGSEPLSPAAKLWQQTVSPESHAPYIHCPLMLLNATNDFHGWLDFSPAILSAVPAPTRAVYSPNMNHHIRKEEAASLVEWMHRTLRDKEPVPISPHVNVHLDNEGVPGCHVRVDESLKVDRVEVYYAMGLRAPPNRFWRLAAVTRGDEGWIAALPIANTWQEVHVFANVHYSQSMCLSSNIVKFVPGQLGTAQATLSSSQEFTANGWRYQHAHTDPSIERVYLIPSGLDPGELRVNPALFGNEITVAATTNIVADAQFAGRPNTALAFQVDGAFPQGLSITLSTDTWTAKSKAFRVDLAEKDLVETSGRVWLLPHRFQTEGGEVLHSWQSVDTLQVQGKASATPAPVLHSFRWQSTKQAPGLHERD